MAENLIQDFRLFCYFATNKSVLSEKVCEFFEQYPVILNLLVIFTVYPKMTI